MRPERDDLNMAIALLMSTRSTCTRAKVGVVITRENRIISTGYVGSPSKSPHCLDSGCVMGIHGGCVRTLHAEAAAISFAAMNGIPLKGSTLYTTCAPCYECAKLIVNAGIVRVCWLHPYRERKGLDFLEAQKIDVNPTGWQGNDWWFMEPLTLTAAIDEALEVLEYELEKNMEEAQE